jgi:effector-binding domain-containing protein
MTYSVEARAQARQPYVAVRTTVPIDEIGAAMGPLFEQLYGWLGTAGIVPLGMPWTRYLSVGTDEVELEVAAPVGAGHPPVAGGMVEGVIPAGEVAVTLHVGPYDQLPGAYAAIHAWLGAQGLAPSGAMWEVYENGPDTRLPQLPPFPDPLKGHPEHGSDASRPVGP